MQHAGITKVDTEVAGPFCYRRFGDRYLLSNDLGRWHFLSKGEFRCFVEGELGPEGELYGKLKEKGFIHGEINLEEALRVVRKRYAFLQDGPERHTLALTSESGNNNMARDVGERAVDMAFISTAQRLEFVFVGGNGNFNDDVLKGLIDFANNKNRLARKDVSFVLRGDISGLGSETTKLLLDNDFTFEASMDAATLAGEETGLSSAIAALNQELATQGRDSRVLCRVYPDEPTMALGASIVPIITALGSNACRVMTASEGDKSPDPTLFGAFYAEVFGAIVATNGVVEATAADFITRVIAGHEARPTENRSPGSDGIGELAYGWEGTVYTSDEGRVLGERGDTIFAVGNAIRDGYHDLMTHPTIRALVLASVGDGQPGYASWVYKPFCGPRPSRNYIDQGSVQGRAGDSSNFLNNQAILDSIFTLLGSETPEREVLEGWAMS